MRARNLVRIFYPDYQPQELAEAATSLTALLNAVKDQDSTITALPSPFTPGQKIIIFRKVDDAYEQYTYVLPDTVAELLNYLEWFVKNEPSSAPETTHSPEEKLSETLAAILMCNNPGCLIDILSGINNQFKHDGAKFALALEALQARAFTLVELLQKQDRAKAAEWRSTLFEKVLLTPEHWEKLSNSS